MYNVGGNIVSKNEYVYTTGELGEPTKVYNYSYGNDWKDQLTSFDGNAIVYDACGNPTSYMGATFTWGRGRLLTKYAKYSTTINFVHDANGIRSGKVKTGVNGLLRTQYLYDSEGRLRVETVGTDKKYYLYSADGIIGFVQDGQRYLYRKNLFGDITAISQGETKLAEYEYDAWGNCTITLDTNGVGTNNPFRYRGYYWDNDIKLYYLMSRYYDPKTGRFINADSFEYLEPKAINGLNLYAYCRNNPVMMTDSYGNSGVVLGLALSFMIGGAIMGAVLGLLSNFKLGSNIDMSFPGKNPMDDENNNTNNDEILTWEDRIFNAFKGGLLGMWAGSAATIIVGLAMTASPTTIPEGIATVAFGTAVFMLLQAPLYAVGIEIIIPDEDFTQKYETGLPQFK